MILGPFRASTWLLFGFLGMAGQFLDANMPPALRSLMHGAPVQTALQTAPRNNAEMNAFLLRLHNQANIASASSNSAAGSIGVNEAFLGTLQNGKYDAATMQLVNTVARDFAKTRHTVAGSATAGQVPVQNLLNQLVGFVTTMPNWAAPMLGKSHNTWVPAASSGVTTAEISFPL